MAVVLALALFAPAARADSQNFDTGWKFALVNKTGITDPTGAYTNAASPSYDDSSWRSIDVPHDWSIELDPVTGTGTGTTSGTGFYQGGLGWYRKTFTLPASAAGKRVAVDFDGVYKDSVIYFNGVQVGAHPYGYTGFEVDLPNPNTDGSPNVLAVKVQHRQPSSRWYSGSGIYRHVHLLVQDQVHIARHGVFVTTPGLEANYAQGFATVHVATTIANPANQDVGISQTVKDAAGTVVAASQTGADLRSDQPHLWSTDDPYLYTLTTELRVGGNVVDSVTTKFGARWFRIDPNEGLYLNGKWMKVKGVDLHHDMGAIGSAINKDALLRQMRIMKSMGVNAFRTSHNPPSPEMLEVCQELGIVMMVEAFDAWNQQKVQFDYARFFTANHTSDIQEMVTSARNNPAVIMWSIGNEIPGSTSTGGIPITNGLISDIKAVDTTRPIVIGSDQYRSVPGPTSPAAQVLAQLDGLGLNYNTAKSVDGLHTAFPTKFLFESESSSETSTRGVYQDPDWPNTGENYTPGKRATSSYDNNLASWTMSGEYGLKKDRDRKYFLGEFLWSGMDYIGEPTPYDVFPVKASFFGAVDTAGFPKDMYWLFRSQWTKEPMVHLLPMNWTDYKPGQDVQVWAYANVDTVELFLNGQSLGVRRFDHKTTPDGREYLETTECSGDDKTITTGACPGSYTSPNGSSGKLHLLWHVPFAPGKLVAVATKDGQEVARDEVDTAGAPDTVKITPDKRAIAADGTSLSYVTVDVVDKDGTMVPSADNELTFDVSGGKLVGLDNGREESAENYKSTRRAAFNGKALAIVQSTRNGGPITVKVSSPGLLPQTATVFAGGGGAEPVYGRGAAGSAPALPATVRVVHADGTSDEQAVSWNAPAALAAGLNAIDGSGGAKAYVTGYTVDHAVGFSTVVPAGTAPTLPGTADVVYSDGTDRRLRVTWDAIPAARYAGFGRFTVQGTIAGVAQKALATVSVSVLVSHGQNLGRVPRLKPAADASYSGITGTTPTVPAGMLDGTTTSGGWSTFYNKAATALLPAVSRAHATEWVSVSWPSYQTFATIRPYFTTSTSHAFPSAFNVTYWDGSAFVPVKNLAVTQAAASNQPSTLSFDPVNTNQVRIEMTSPSPGTSAGFFQITELEVNGELIQPTILDLKVNRVPVPGFDPATSAYTIPVQYNATPVITATPASDETVSYTLPASLPGDAVVTVKSADGTAQTVYTLHLIPADIHNGDVGGSVPATLSLSLGTPAAFGAFTPGVAHDYTATTTATVISTAGDAALTVADPSRNATGHLVNGAFALPQPLQAAGSPLTSPVIVKTWSAPVSNDPVSVAFKQPIAANDPLRTGTYAKTLTFTLSTTNP